MILDIGCGSRYYASITASHELLFLSFFQSRTPRRVENAHFDAAQL